MAETILLIVLFLGLLFGYRRLRNYKIAQREVAAELQKVWPVWAAQGPFRDGEDSAYAMQQAYTAVFGQNKSKDREAQIRLHKSSFSAKPEEWESTRQTALSIASTEQTQLGDFLKKKRMKEIAGASILVLSPDESKNEVFSNVVEQLLDCCQSDILCRHVIIMLSVESVYPYLEKLREYEFKSTEWLTLFDEMIAASVNELANNPDLLPHIHELAVQMGSTPPGQTFP